MSENNTKKPSSLILAESIVKICEDNKAVDIKIFDVRDNAMQTEFFVICSGNSDPHLKAIAANVEKEMKLREF